MYDVSTGKSFAYSLIDGEMQSDAGPVVRHLQLQPLGQVLDLDLEAGGEARPNAVHGRAEEVAGVVGPLT